MQEFIFAYMVIGLAATPLRYDEQPGLVQMLWSSLNWLPLLLFFCYCKAKPRIRAFLRDRFQY